MICVVNVLTEPLIWELEPVNDGIDQVADVERHAHCVDRVPNTDEMDLALLTAAEFCLEFLGRSIAGFAAQQSHQNSSVTTAVSSVRLIHALIESICGGLIPGIDDAAFDDEAREGPDGESAAAKT